MTYVDGGGLAKTASLDWWIGESPLVSIAGWLRLGCLQEEGTTRVRKGRKGAAKERKLPWWQGTSHLQRMVIFALRNLGGNFGTSYQISTCNLSRKAYPQDTDLTTPFMFNCKSPPRVRADICPQLGLMTRHGVTCSYGKDSCCPSRWSSRRSPFRVMYCCTTKTDFCLCTSKWRSIKYPSTSSGIRMFSCSILHLSGDHSAKPARKL